MWLLYFLTPSCIPKTEQRNTSIKKTTVCHHRVGCARLSDVGHVARKVEVAGKNRKETAISLLSPCAFFLTYSPGDEVDFTALLHYYLGAWNRLVIRLLFVNQARLLTRLIWLFHVTYDYRAPPPPPSLPLLPTLLAVANLGTNLSDLCRHSFLSFYCYIKTRGSRTRYKQWVTLTPERNPDRSVDQGSRF